MIKLSEHISINADANIVWEFLTDLKKSLSFNRFHINIVLPNRFSINNKNKFLIIHNFGFGEVEMEATVIELVPMRKIIISEGYKHKSIITFLHEIKFEIRNNDVYTDLEYSVKGTYGNKVQDITFTPILKGVIKEEIIKIKKAIEASIKISDSPSFGKMIT